MFKKLLMSVCSLMLSISVYANNDNILYLIEKAQQGDARAQNDLGVYYLEQGYHDYGDKAFYWLSKSARQNFAQGQYNLGVFYDKFKGQYYKAFDWYFMSAHQGNPLAQFELAIAYHYGRIVKQDDKKSFAWFEKSARGGYASAQANVAFSYLKGIGVEQNILLALKWFKISCRNGIELSCETYDQVIQENPTYKLLSLFN